MTACHHRGASENLAATVMIFDLDLDVCWSFFLHVHEFYKIFSILALVWDTIMKQVATGSLFNKVYFNFWIMRNHQASLPLAPTIERIKCTSMYKHNNGINWKLFLCHCWKSFLSCLLTVVPHSPEQTQTTQVASILQKDSFNQWSCMCLFDKLMEVYSRQLLANTCAAAWSK